MTDKEERILILKADKEDFVYNHFNGNFFITRAEAIEKIAEATYAWELDFKPSLPWSEYKKFNSDGANLYMGIAEAALAALLEEVR